MTPIFEPILMPKTKGNRHQNGPKNGPKMAHFWTIFGLGKWPILDPFFGHLKKGPFWYNHYRLTFQK